MTPSPLLIPRRAWDQLLSVGLLVQNGRHWHLQDAGWVACTEYTPGPDHFPADFRGLEAIPDIVEVATTTPGPFPCFPNPEAKSLADLFPTHNKEARP